jgi:hypothetical protein
MVMRALLSRLPMMFVLSIPLRCARGAKSHTDERTDRLTLTTHALSLNTWLQIRPYVVKIMGRACRREPPAAGASWPDRIEVDQHEIAKITEMIHTASLGTCMLAFMPPSPQPLAMSQPLLPARYHHHTMACCPSLSHAHLIALSLSIKVVLEVPPHTHTHTHTHSLAHTHALSAR